MRSAYRAFVGSLDGADKQSVKFDNFRHAPADWLLESIDEKSRRAPARFDGAACGEYTGWLRVTI